MPLAAVLAALAWQETPSSPIGAGAQDLAEGRIELAASRALERGLDFLAQRVAATLDGSLPVDDALDESNYQAPIGITALGALAFLAAGHSPGRGPYGETVDRMLGYLLDHVDLAPESPTYGYISSGAESTSGTHGHGYATLALAQAYGMAPQRSERIERALRAAVACIERSQGNEGGWYYDPILSARHEGSVTVCLVQALRAAQNAGIQVDAGVIDRALDYVRRLQNADGRFRYGLDDQDTSVALTAAGVATLNMLGRYDDKVVHDAVDAIWAGLAIEAEKGERPRFPFYQRLYLAQAFWQLDDTSLFERWFAAERERVLRAQDPDGSWSDPRFGACYATASNCLVLAMPEGLLPIFQR